MITALPMSNTHRCPLPLRHSGQVRWRCSGQPREGNATMVLLRHLLGDALRRLRLRQGRTLREVSASARVSLGYLSEVERGQKEASSELLAAICSALGAPLSQVLREVSDNFALAELQSEPVFADVIEPPIGVTEREQWFRPRRRPGRAGRGHRWPGRVRADVQACRAASSRWRWLADASRPSVGQRRPARRWRARPRHRDRPGGWSDRCQAHRARADRSGPEAHCSRPDADRDEPRRRRASLRSGDPDRPRDHQHGAGLTIRYRLTPS